MFERLKKINFLCNRLDNFKNTLNKGIWIIKLLSMLIILVTFVNKNIYCNFHTNDQSTFLES